MASGSGKADLRMLRLPFFAEEQLRILRANMERAYFDDDTASSAMLALQLNDPIYDFTINIKHEQTTRKLTRLVPSAPKQPRTLGMLSKSRVWRPFAADGEDNGDNDGTEPTPSGDTAGVTSLPSDTAYQRHPLYSPAPHVLQHNLSPHACPLALLDTPIPSWLPPPQSPSPQLPAGAEPKQQLSIAQQTGLITTSGAGAGAGAGATETTTTALAATKTKTAARSTIAGPPKFACTVFTPDHPTSTTIRLDTIMDGTTTAALPMDLIFSILPQNCTDSTWWLTELDILIPLGPSSSSPAKLMTRYEGAGARMLSNLRFNVLVAVGIGDKTKGQDDMLVLRLLPRRSKGWIAAKDIGSELSFVLCLAGVNLFKEKAVGVQVKTAAWYTWRYNKVPRQDTFEVVVERG